MINKISTATKFSSTATTVKGRLNKSNSSWGKFAPIDLEKRGKIVLPNRLEERLKLMKRKELPPIRTPRPK